MAQDFEDDDEWQAPLPSPPPPTAVSKRDNADDAQLYDPFQVMVRPSLSSTRLI